MRPDIIIINIIYLLVMIPLWIISELVHGLTDSIYLIPVVAIFVITVLFHKMDWKKCGIVFVLASVICACIYYSINIKEHMPPETALGMEVFSKCVLRSSIRMSFYILLNLILWRFITAFYHRMSERYHVIAKKRIFAGFFAVAYALFIIMYINTIYKFESSILDPMITEVFNNIPLSELQASQADFEETYVEGIIPAGNYYFNGETSRGAHTFCIDEQGRGYSIRNRNGQNYVSMTYTYDPDTGIYTFDNFVENSEGIKHYIEEGYFNEEDCSIVITKWGYASDNTSVRVLSTLKYELIRR